MTETRIIVDTLKELLRGRRVTYAQVAAHLGLSEPSIKRMFSRAAFSLDRLEKVCELAGVRVSDLARRAERRAEPITRLTPEQESQLLADPKLILVAYLVLNNWSFEEIVDQFAISETEAVARLARLDKLGMLELLPGNRVRRLVARNFTWRPDGPVQAFFADQLRDFFDSDFGGQTEHQRFAGALLSMDSIRRLRKSIDRLTREFEESARNDWDLPLDEKFSVGVLAAMRPWQVPMFRSMLRNER